MFDGLRSPALGVASIVLFMSLSVSSFEIGITHTQYTADYGDSSSVARARQLITNGVKYQNQHIMGKKNRRNDLTSLIAFSNDSI